MLHEAAWRSKLNGGKTHLFKSLVVAVRKPLDVQRIWIRRAVRSDRPTWVDSPSSVTEGIARIAVPKYSNQFNKGQTTVERLGLTSHDSTHAASNCSHSTSLQNDHTRMDG